MGEDLLIMVVLVITGAQAMVTAMDIARLSEVTSFSVILGISSGGIRIAVMGISIGGIIVADRDIFVAMEVDTEAIIGVTIEYGAQSLNLAAFMAYISAD